MKTARTDGGTAELSPRRQATWGDPHLEGKILSGANVGGKYQVSYHDDVCSVAVGTQDCSAPPRPGWCGAVFGIARKDYGIKHWDSGTVEGLVRFRWGDPEKRRCSGDGRSNRGRLLGWVRVSGSVQAAAYQVAREDQQWFGQQEDQPLAQEPCRVGEPEGLLGGEPERSLGTWGNEKGQVENTVPRRRWGTEHASPGGPARRPSRHAARRVREPERQAGKQNRRNSLPPVLSTPRRQPLNVSDGGSVAMAMEKIS